MQASIIDSQTIHKFLSEHREQCSLEIDACPDDNWIIDGGCLRHKSVEFFEIAAVRDSSNQRQLILRQQEPALVGLLCATVRGEQYALISARCEPGLHNICQLTSTVQSTPSNYLRRHNGSPTPFIEYFISDVNGSRTIHDSLQSDWADYYLGKKKRFQIVEVDELLPVDGPQHWIRVSDLRSLMLEDYAVTSDLRVALLLLRATEMAQSRASSVRTISSIAAESCTESGTFELLDMRELVNIGHRWHVVDDFNRSVVFVHFSSVTREVAEWTQPLLALENDKTINLWFDTRTSEPRFAVARRTQLGLEGKSQWFPAEATRASSLVGRSVDKVVRTSAEGGRFYRHGVILGLHHWNGETFDEPFEWWSLRDLLSASATSMAVSIELRMISSLAI